MNLQEILKQLNIEAEHFGNVEFKTLGVSNEKEIENYCTFIDDAKFVDSFNKNVSVILTTKELKDLIKFENKTIVENPRSVFFRVHEYLVDNGDNEYARQKNETVIGDNCSFGKYVDIAESGVVIGNNVKIESFVSIKENTVIGNNVIIRAGTIVGGEGFEVKEDDMGTFVVSHGGGVIIKDNVEIQQNTAIDKGLYPWDDTVIGQDSKIDNFVHVGHGVKIGQKCKITANVTIGGRTIIEDNCYLGISSTIKQLLRICENANISMGAVVSKDVPANGHVTGNLAIDHGKFIDHIKRINK